jgi:hypothetical protein
MPKVCTDYDSTGRKIHRKLQAEHLAYNKMPSHFEVLPVITKYDSSAM